MSKELESKIQQCIVDALVEAMIRAAIVGTVVECRHANHLTREKVDAVYESHLLRFIN